MFICRCALTCMSPAVSLLLPYAIPTWGQTPEQPNNTRGDRHPFAFGKLTYESRKSNFTRDGDRDTRQTYQCQWGQTPLYVVRQSDWGQTTFTYGALKTRFKDEPTATDEVLALAFYLPRCTGREPWGTVNCSEWDSRRFVAQNRMQGGHMTKGKTRTRKFFCTTEKKLAMTQTI